MKHQLEVGSTYEVRDPFHIAFFDLPTKVKIVEKRKGGYYGDDGFRYSKTGLHVGNCHTSYDLVKKISD